MKSLTHEQIIAIVEAIPNGRIARVTYKSDLSSRGQNAASRKAGYVVTKVTETTGRFGVDYDNIGSVMARRAAQEVTEKRNYTNHYEWVIENKVQYNTAKDKYYIVLASFPGGHNTKSKYIVSHNGVDTEYTSEEFKSNEELRSLMVPSYFNKSGDAPEVRTIMFTNILAINAIGERVNF